MTTSATVSSTQPVRPRSSHCSCVRSTPLAARCRRSSPATAIGLQTSHSSSELPNCSTGPVAAGRLSNSQRCASGFEAPSPSTSSSSLSMAERTSTTSSTSVDPHVPPPGRRRQPAVGEEHGQQGRLRPVGHEGPGAEPDRERDPRQRARLLHADLVPGVRRAARPRPAHRTAAPSRRRCAGGARARAARPAGRAWPGRRRRAAADAGPRSGRPRRRAARAAAVSSQRCRGDDGSEHAQPPVRPRLHAAMVPGAAPYVRSFGPAVGPPCLPSAGGRLRSLTQRTPLHGGLLSMATNGEKAYELHQKAIGETEGTGEWVEIDPGAHQRLRRRHRGPPVHPRRPRGLQADVAVGRADRARLPHPVAAHPPVGVDPDAAGAARGHRHGRQLRLREGPLRQPGQGRPEDPRHQRAVGRRARRTPTRCRPPRRSRSRSRARASPRSSPSG